MTETMNSESILNFVRLLTVAFGMFVAVKIYTTARNERRNTVDDGAILAAIILNSVVLIYLIIIPFRSVYARIAQDVSIIIIYYVIYRHMLFEKNSANNGEGDNEQKDSEQEHNPRGGESNDE